MNERQKNMSDVICPSDKVLDGFLSHTLTDEQALAVIDHVERCPQCKGKLADLVEWSWENFSANALSTTAEEEQRGREFIARKTAIRRYWRGMDVLFMPQQEHLAAAGGQTADQLQEQMAVKSGFLHFEAAIDKQNHDYWFVKLSIPVVVTDKSRLRMQVFEYDEDRCERPVMKGILTFCGVKLKVIDGRASMSLSEFNRAKGFSMISFCREEGRNIPGEPVLGFGMRT